MQGDRGEEARKKLTGPTLSPTRLKGAQRLHHPPMTWNVNKSTVTKVEEADSSSTVGIRVRGRGVHEKPANKLGARDWTEPKKGGPPS